jgi:hypothetical protein
MLKLKLYFDLADISTEKDFRVSRNGIDLTVSRRICVTEVHRWMRLFPPLKVSRYYLFPAVSCTKAGSKFIDLFVKACHKFTGKVGMLLEDLLLMLRLSELERSSRSPDHHNSSFATMGVNS